MTFEPKIGGPFVFCVAQPDGTAPKVRGTIMDIRARAIDPKTQTWLPITSPMQERIAFVAVLGDLRMHEVDIGSQRDQEVIGEPEAPKPSRRVRRTPTEGKPND